MDLMTVLERGVEELSFCQSGSQNSPKEGGSGGL